MFHIFSEDCGKLTILNGQVNSSTSLIGSVVKVLCSRGYRITGSDDVVCQVDGTWSETPKCQRKGNSYLKKNSKFVFQSGTKDLFSP